ncbi:MAG: FAD-dependent oxidoreductase [Chloroflexota bacterium]
MYDLIIIGGGPAGLTASIYAIRKRLNVLNISKDLGGKTNMHLSIPWTEDHQVIRGLEVVTKFKQELEYLDFAHKVDKVSEITKSGKVFTVATESGKSYQTKAVIIATGVHMEPLNVPGEKEFYFKGLCYSAISYAQLFIDKKVVVIGDDELALRSAAELSTVAAEVQLVGPGKQVLKSDIGQKLEQSENVTIYHDHQVISVNGNGFAKAVTIKSPDGVESELEMDGAFIEKSLKANTQAVKDLIKLDQQQRVIIDSFNRTSEPGVFAAGDVTNIYAEQVLIAIGEGAKAALSAYDFLLKY